jgi:pyruvate dehydrogenase E2 component (dihydrolipoamide acetyltransferase)
MAEKFLMPKLSPTMEEGQISRWLKQEGDTFEANETIAEVDTDKATMEMTALSGGTLLKILKGAGDTALLGEAIAITGEKGEDISAMLADSSSSNGAAKTATQAPPAESESAESATAKPSSDTNQITQQQTVASNQTQKNETETEGRSYDYDRPDAKEDAQAASPSPQTKEESSNGSRLIVSPIAARMAAENSIDLKSIKGSGPSGRIIKRDIETVISQQSTVNSQQLAVSSQPEEKSSSANAPSFSAPQVQGASAFRDETTSKMRRVIAQRLSESIGPIPTFYLTVEIEMDNALEFRKQINASIAPEKVSVNDVIVKVAAMASLKHPFVNSSYQEDKIRFYEDADVGVAVAIDEGLITPVIRGANKKGIAEISREVKEMAERAREKKLQPEEYTGATFSISNLGMFGIEQFTAIINPPEAAIFAVGSAAPKAVVRDGEIVVRNIMNVTMSCDHRVIDGATGAKFLQTFKQMLENPVLMLM